MVILAVEGYWGQLLELLCSLFSPNTEMTAQSLDLVLEGIGFLIPVRPLVLGDFLTDGFGKAGLVMGKVRRWKGI